MTVPNVFVVSSPCLASGRSSSLMKSSWMGARFRTGVPTSCLTSVHAAGQVGDAVGTRQAKPGGELAKRDFAVAAAEPGSDGASDVGISALGQCRSVQAIVFRHRPEDGCGIASGELSRLVRGRIADHRPGQLAKPSQEPL